MKRIDLTGQIFGRLIVVEHSHFQNGKHSFWKCECSCKKIVIVRMDHLKSGETISCGCYKKENNGKQRFIDLTDKKFNRWIVISISHKKDDIYYWNCLCDCGTKRIVSGVTLKNGLSKSCGCYSVEVLIKRNLGENNSNWRGGCLEYPPEWTNELRESIRNRDRHKCQYPDCNYDDTKENRRLSVHHINSDKNNCDELNLICLCNSHHRYVEQQINNGYTEFWKYYFYQITNDYR